MPPIEPSPPLRILIVDDEAIVRNAIAQVVECEGHEVTAVDGGQAGIDAFLAARLAGRPFDAVITDLWMPRVDGRMVAASIKAASPGTLVIVLTGSGSHPATGVGPPLVDCLLGKPPKMRELRPMLAKCAAARQGQT